MATRHVLITHGTDTMAWCLPYLTYALKRLPFNVAITGSQRPLDAREGWSDAMGNLESAVRLLGLVRSPAVFAVFDSGRRVFTGSMLKVNKWDEDAFTGRDVLRMKDGTVQWANLPLRAGGPRTDWALHVVRTGGTIESVAGNDGILVPRGNSVLGFVNDRLKSLFETSPGHDLYSVDSSDMTPERWAQLAQKVAELAAETGAPTWADTSFASRVGVVVTNPWKTEKDYRREFAEWRGVVLAGYGGGNGNLDVPAGRSVVPAVKAALREGKPVVLSSQVALGDTDFVYRNGHELVAAGAVSAAGLTLPHAQIKLGYLLGHRDELEDAAETARVPFRDLLDRCMTAGAGFRNAESLLRYSGLRGYSPLPDDPFVDVPFEEGLGHVVRKTIPPGKRPGRRVVDPIARLADTLKANGLADPGTRRHWAAILKPDAVVGGTVSGEPIDAAASLATLVESLFGLTPLVVDLYDLGLDGLREAVTRVAGRQQSLAAFLRTFGLLSVEGGRQSVYDDGSFQGPLTRTGYLDLFESLLLGRTLQAVRPGLFICLGHQGYAASLARLAGRVLVENRGDLSRAARAVPGRSPKALEAFLERAARMATTWRVRGDAGDALAEGIAHPRAAVHPNEKGEKLVVELRPYGSGSAPHKVPAEVRKAHEEVAARHLTSVEEVIAGPAVRLSMLHGDEVDEAVLLFLNWFYSGLASHLGPAVGPGVATGHAVLDDLAARLPVGVEITSCTLYRDVLRTEAARAGRRPAASTPASGHSLTEVGSTAVYYRDPAGTGVVHDVTAQFHPELIGVDRVYGPADLRSLPLGQLSDGVRMLARMGVGA